MKPGNAVDEIAEAILRYVTANPDAADTVDGICEWWIPHQPHADTRSDVLAALALLAQRQQIHPRTGVDGQVLYRARPAPPT
jgi:hypothetical protein